MLDPRRSYYYFKSDLFLLIGTFHSERDKSETCIHNVSRIAGLVFTFNSLRERVLLYLL